MIKNLLLEFLRDGEKNLSSKRLGFIIVLINAVIISWFMVGYFFYNDQHDMLMEIFNTSWLVVCSFSGVVLAEIFKKK